MNKSGDHKDNTSGEKGQSESRRVALSGLSSSGTLVVRFTLLGKPDSGTQRGHATLPTRLAVTKAGA